MAKMTSTKELTGTRVFRRKKGDKLKKIGKIRRCVFHPTEKRCIGFIVKRPDLLWMFHRKDLFVAFDGFELEDGRVVLNDDSAATGNGALKAMNVDWNKCILWDGLPVLTDDGKNFGTVENVTFAKATGKIDSFETSMGMAANAVLGTYTVPTEYVLGFKKGVGVALSSRAQSGETEDTEEFGAIMVSSEARELVQEGGIAEKAGQATAVALNTAESKVKPKVDEAAKAAGEAVNKGAYATGKQLGKASTMFTDFADEYKKAAAPTKSTKSSGKSSASSSAKKPAKKANKNMFAAFKEEFDKAQK